MTRASPCAMAAGQWQEVCGLAEIPPLGARVVRRTPVDIAIFRTADNAVFALDDRCPHRAGPLSQGLVYGRHVACPLHNWQIGLVDGAAVAPDVGCTATHRTEIRNGRVYVWITHGDSSVDRPPS